MLAATFALFAALPVASVVMMNAGQACPQLRLPIYSHNDYRSRRALFDALEAGLRGVEVDLFLTDGVLSAGHNQGEARRGPSFEDGYLKPLDSLLAECGRLTPAEASPFLLLIEIKKPSQATYDEIVAALRRHPDLFDAHGHRSLAPVEVVLVGWIPSYARPFGDSDQVLLARQHRMRNPADTLLADKGLPVRLVSVDYGKTMGRWWTRARTRRRWIQALSDVKRKFPQHLLRVHNVPADRALIEQLLNARVDLIGASDVWRFAALLEGTPESSGRIRQ